MQKIAVGSIQKIDYKTLEEIKKLRTNISFLDPSIKVINITSAVGKEGKSMISFWLAHTLAETGKKVVLMDANLRNKEKQIIYTVDNNNSSVIDTKKKNKHQMEKSNTESYSYGKTLYKYLNGKVKKEEIVLDSDINNMDFVLSGEVPTNPSELLSDALFKDLIAYLRINYDYVIIDTPAIGEVTDGVIIAEHCDGCLLVMEPGVVPYKLAQKVKMQIENSKSKLLGVVLNKA